MAPQRRVRLRTQSKQKRGPVRLSTSRPLCRAQDDSTAWYVGMLLHDAPCARRGADRTRVAFLLSRGSRRTRGICLAMGPRSGNSSPTSSARLTRGARSQALNFVRRARTARPGSSSRQPLGGQPLCLQKPLVCTEACERPVILLVFGEQALQGLGGERATSYAAATTCSFGFVALDRREGVTKTPSMRRQSVCSAPLGCTTSALANIRLDSQLSDAAESVAAAPFGQWSADRRRPFDCSSYQSRLDVWCPRTWEGHRAGVEQGRSREIGLRYTLRGPMSGTECAQGFA